MRTGSRSWRWALGAAWLLGCCSAWSGDVMHLFVPQPRNFDRAGGKVVAAYVGSWTAVERLEQLPVGGVTHLLYAFLHACGPGQLASDAAACQGQRDFELAEGARDAAFDAAFVRLKRRAPHLRVLASIGGWGGSDPFFHLANDPARRAVLVASALQFLRAHPGFDGLDIDWEHPGDNGAANGVPLGSPQDGQGYADLMQDLRRGLDRLSAQTGRRYLLSTAVNPASKIIERINFQQAETALDLVFMMSYDFYGPWTATAGHHSALASPPQAVLPQVDDSVEASVDHLLRAGVPASKIVVGVAMYGRGFTGVARPVQGASYEGVYADAEGAMPYREIAADFLDGAGRGRHGYQLVLDSDRDAYSLYNRALQRWMSYDDPRAVLEKGRFVRQRGLAGLFAWELSQDNGELLNAMQLGLGDGLVPP
ncbi:MAG: glycoside hydrolase family 18 protein [Burkholderiaceae bacterium]|nr:glycoside hydrolase family 18 protein [Roseateles sp.]MBV8468999.1 glycoside hydrolase family 18 protein [Burkholderiaceae bacterium]